MKQFFSILLTAGMMSGLGAQQVERCYANHVIDHHDQQFPGYKQAVEATYQQALDQMSFLQEGLGKVPRPDTIYRVPVVVHRRVVNQLIEVGPCFSRIECCHSHVLLPVIVRYYVRFLQP